MSTTKHRKGKMWDELRESKIRVPLTFYAATASQENSNVPFDGARTNELVSDQIRVVGA